MLSFSLCEVKISNVKSNSRSPKETTMIELSLNLAHLNRRVCGCCSRIALKAAVQPTVVCDWRLHEYIGASVCLQWVQNSVRQYRPEWGRFPWINADCWGMTQSSGPHRKSEGGNIDLRGAEGEGRRGKPTEWSLHFCLSVFPWFSCLHLLYIQYSLSLFPWKSASDFMGSPWNATP